MRVTTTSKFKRDLRLAQRRGRDLERLWAIVELLEVGSPVPPQHKPHPLSGPYAGTWECHVEPDWLLIWATEQDTVLLLRTGTHSDLFR
ncbi:MAG: type II toxin-antitoxin system YafQ family toxin [Chloroflexota bacterium]|nr:type II toxin-antitoxin system YafQ family toxin [Chloroflexota bacterium]MDE2969836.1 type II toxin-antitoxin system YafQ family toxin [Chloroflexota bacterium]